MSNLAKRCIFAFTAMPVVALLLWYGDYTRLVLILFLNIVAAYEWAKMVNAAHDLPSKLISAVSPICAVALSLPWMEPRFFNFMPLISAFVILLYIAIAFVLVDVKHLFPWLVLQAAAPFYIGLWGTISFGLFKSGQGWVECSQFLVVITTLWACDSAAYFAGRYLGKHKLSPQISPKKTWEGAIGGTLFAIFWFWIWTRTGFGYTVFDVSFGWVAGLAFIIAVAGQMGDLLISALKRWSGIKDSGKIFPGHGGVLDRTDSFYLAAPIATILLSYCIRIN